MPFRDGCSGCHLLAATRLGQGRSWAMSLILARVVSAILPSASLVKKAWCAVTMTFGKVVSRAKTSSWRIWLE